MTFERDFVALIDGVHQLVKAPIVLALDRLEALVRNRLKQLQYRADVLDGFLAGTGPSLDLPPPAP